MFGKFSGVSGGRIKWLAEDIGWMAEQMVKEAGCLGNFLAFQGAESNLFSMEEYETLIKESDQIVLAAANQTSSFNILHFCGWNQVKNQLELWKQYPGCVVNWAVYVEHLTLEQGRRYSSSFNILHFCGWNQVKNQLELWKQYPGCVVNWAVYVEHLTLEQGRRYFGMRPVMGGFDNRREGLLYCGDQKQVEEETRRLIRVYKETFGNTDSLILGADCSFLPDFQAKRFRWVLETARKTANG